MCKKQGIIFFLLAALLLWASPVSAGVMFDFNEEAESSSEQPLGEPEEENEESEQELKEFAIRFCWIHSTLLESAPAFDIEEGRLDALEFIGQGPDLPRAPPITG